MFISLVYYLLALVSSVICSESAEDGENFAVRQSFALAGSSTPLKEQSHSHEIIALPGMEDLHRYSRQHYVTVTAAPFLTDRLLQFNVAASLPSSSFSTFTAANSNDAQLSEEESSISSASGARSLVREPDGLFGVSGLHKLRCVLYAPLQPDESPFNDEIDAFGSSRISLHLCSKRLER